MIRSSALRIRLVLVMCSMIYSRVSVIPLPMSTLCRLIGVLPAATRALLPSKTAEANTGKYRPCNEQEDKRRGGEAHAVGFPRKVERSALEFLERLEELTVRYYPARKAFARLTMETNAWTSIAASSVVLTR